MANQTAPYAQRLLEFTFQIAAAPATANAGSQQLTVGGAGGNLRAVAHIEFANAPTTGMAHFRVYGLTLDLMNQLSTAGLVYKVGANKVVVRAGDALSGMTTVFRGEIIESWPDINQPDAPLFILAQPSALVQLKPTTPTSFPGSVPAPTALSQIAKAAGLTLENNGVNTVLQSPYFHGTAWNQLMSCIRAAGCFGFLDGITNTFAVWPKNGSRSGNASTISGPPDGYMIGYPKFQALQTRIRVLFNPNIFAGNGPGHQVQVRSQLAAANGKFTINSIVHDLSSELPDGPWETTFMATPVQG